MNASKKKEWKTTYLCGLATLFVGKCGSILALSNRYLATGRDVRRGNSYHIPLPIGIIAYAKLVCNCVLRLFVWHKLYSKYTKNAIDIYQYIAIIYLIR